MKKSTLITFVCGFVLSASAHAEALKNNTVPQVEKISYSDEFKRKTRDKIENEPEYSQKYFGIALTLLRAETAVNMSLADVENKITTAENEMFLAISKAGKLRDGTLVFVSRENSRNYFAINGRQISSAEIANITPQKNISYWEDYVVLYERRKEHLDNRAEIIQYRDKTLADSRRKVPDHDLLGLSEQRKKDWLEYKRNNP